MLSDADSLELRIFEAPYGASQNLVISTRSGAWLASFYGPAYDVSEVTGQKGLHEYLRAFGNMPIAYIETIEVPTAQQRKGIGLMLIEEALKIFRKARVQAVYLHAGVGSTGFWERIGFESVDCCRRDEYPVYRISEPLIS